MQFHFKRESIRAFLQHRIITSPQTSGFRLQVGWIKGGGGKGCIGTLGGEAIRLCLIRAFFFWSFLSLSSFCKIICSLLLAVRLSTIFTKCSIYTEQYRVNSNIDFLKKYLTNKLICCERIELFFYSFTYMHIFFPDNYFFFFLDFILFLNLYGLVLER